MGDDLAATSRFTDRVADYVRYRPDYPVALYAWLHDELGVRPSWKVADIGAGTGISSKLFLDAGHEVPQFSVHRGNSAASSVSIN